MVELQNYRNIFENSKEQMSLITKIKLFNFLNLSLFYTHNTVRYQGLKKYVKFIRITNLFQEFYSNTLDI